MHLQQGPYHKIMLYAWYFAKHMVLRCSTFSPTLGLHRVIDPCNCWDYIWSITVYGKHVVRVQFKDSFTARHNKLYTFVRKLPEKSLDSRQNTSSWSTSNNTLKQFMETQRLRNYLFTLNAERGSSMNCRSNVLTGKIKHQKLKYFKLYLPSWAETLLSFTQLDSFHS